MTDPKLPAGWEYEDHRIFDGTKSIVIDDPGGTSRVGLNHGFIVIENDNLGEGRECAGQDVAAVLAVIDANGLNTTANELRDKLDKSKSAADVPRCKTCPCWLLLDNVRFCTVWASYKTACNENGYCSFHPDARTL